MEQWSKALGGITQVSFKNSIPFKICSTENDGSLIDRPDFINITMPMYNLIECSGNYSDTSKSLWGFKWDDIVNNASVANDNNSPSFEYKASIVDDTANDGTKNGVKIAVPLKDWFE